MPKQIQIVTRTFRCPISLSDQIDLIADQSERHASEVMREAIRCYLSEQQQPNQNPGEQK